MLSNFSIYKKALAAFFLAELFSYFSYSIPQMNPGLFWVLATAFLGLAIWRLEAGVMIVLAELFIGSKGYLYFIELGSFKLSIRIAIWSLLMLVWLGKFALAFWQERTLKAWVGRIKATRFGLAFSVLFLLAAWGLLNGWLTQGDPKSVFLDANAWIYFGLVFPLYWVRKNKQLPHTLWSVFWAATTWLSIKTLFLLYIFSHGQTLLIFSLYRWVRDTGIGEITQIEGGFYRVFIQSQIYNLFAFFFAACWLAANASGQKLIEYFRKKETKIVLTLLSLNLITILLSFSRSFWVGAAAGFAMSGLWLIFKAAKSEGAFFKNLLRSVRTLLTAGVIAIILSVAVIGTTIALPWPRPTGGFNATDLFSERLTEADESAIGSRWALLPKLWEQIESSPISGKGFGAEVTYKSQDPRVLKISPDGNYTTSAFEWGWLDIWLKLGIFGLLSYLYLLYKIGREDWRTPGSYGLPNGSFTIAIITLAAVHVFTPYLNHPLGIGLVLIAAALVDQE